MSGRPQVVFVPGFMQRGAAWAPVAERLGQRYPTVEVDHRASTLAGRLAEIEVAAAAGAVLCGYSLGGRLALHAALRAAGAGGASPEPEPEPGRAPRGRGRFGALVLVGASAGIDDPRARAERRAADERLAAWIEQAPIEQVVAHWETLPVFAGQPPELVAAQRPGRLSHDPRALAELLRSAGQGAPAPVWSELPRLGALPVLALAGERDAPYRAAARRIAGSVPNGRALTIAGAGHAAHLEQPAAVAGALAQFLDEHLGERGVVGLDAEAGPGRD